MIATNKNVRVYATPDSEMCVVKLIDFTLKNCHPILLVSI